MKNREEFEKWYTEDHKEANDFECGKSCLRDAWQAATEASAKIAEAHTCTSRMCACHFHIAAATRGDE